MNKMRKKLNGVKKLTAVFTLVLMVIQCLPLTALAGIGEVKIINRGDTPTMPSNLKATIQTGANGRKYILLTWDASKDTCSGIKHYNIYRNGLFMESTKNRKYEDYKVNDQERYRYKIVAIDYNNHTSRPNQTSVLTLYNPPARKFINIKTNEPTWKKPLKIFQLQEGQKFIQTLDKKRNVVWVNNRSIAVTNIQPWGKCGYYSKPDENRDANKAKTTPTKETVNKEKTKDLDKYKVKTKKKSFSLTRSCTGLLNSIFGKKSSAKTNMLPIKQAVPIAQKSYFK